VDHHIFTGTDIDSTTSYMLFNWFSNKRIPVTYVSRDNIKEKVSAFFRNESQAGKIVYFINLDTSKISKLVDRGNVVIIDHHPNHIAAKSKYVNCKTIMKEFTSCSKFVYNLMSQKFDTKLTKEQKVLMLLVDDYESYNFKINGSYELGVIYDNLQGSKPVRFYSLYNKGFTGFTGDQIKVIEYFKHKFEKLKTELQVFTAGPIYIKGLSKYKKSYNYVSTFATGYINETSDFLLKKYKSDICIITNLETKRVFIRRSKKCDANLKYLAAMICEGWGYHYAAGGKITDKFLTFSKLFFPINNNG